MTLIYAALLLINNCGSSPTTKPNVERSANFAEKKVVINKNSELWQFLKSVDKILKETEHTKDIFSKSSHKFWGEKIVYTVEAIEKLIEEEEPSSNFYKIVTNLGLEYTKFIESLALEKASNAKGAKKQEIRESIKKVEKRIEEIFKGSGSFIEKVEAFLTEVPKATINLVDKWLEDENEGKDSAEIFKEQLKKMFSYKQNKSTEDKIITFLDFEYGEGKWKKEFLKYFDIPEETLNKHNLD